jgi:hypothetical protein
MYYKAVNIANNVVRAFCISPERRSFLGQASKFSKSNLTDFLPVVDEKGTIKSVAIIAHYCNSNQEFSVNSYNKCNF